MIWLLKICLQEQLIKYYMILYCYNIAKNPKYGKHQHRLASVVYKFFDEKASVSVIKTETTSKQQLTEDLDMPIITKFEKRKV